MTKKMPNLFEKAPPKGEFKTLDDIVDDWEFRFGTNGISKHMRDEVVEYCIQARNFIEAVDRACSSLRPSGKLHNHQSRVPAAVRRKFRDNILKDDLVADMLQQMHSFDELHDALDHLKPPGIGPVTLYDVATRIAAYLNIEPESLYLHAGVREGWQRLHGRRYSGLQSQHVDGQRGKGIRVVRIPKDKLPKALQRIPCDQVEDMLCAYRDYLKPELLGEE